MAAAYEVGQSLWLDYIQKSLLDGEPIGWNLGYGFSDRTPATENMIFYQGTAHKLDEVTFHMDTGNYLAPWKITSAPPAAATSASTWNWQASPRR